MEKFEDIKKRICKEDFEEFYKDHLQKEVMEHFGISQFFFNKLLVEFDIIPHSRAECGLMSCRKKYGVNNVFQLESTKEKSRKTKLERYGDETYHNTEKAKETCKKVFGCEFPSQNDEIRKKVESTVMDRYGVSNVFQSCGVKEKSKKTKFDRYGDENYSNVPKKVETFIERYGVTNPGQIESLKGQRIEKSSETCLKKYGVAFNCLTDMCTSSLTNASTNSNPNKRFSDLLNECGIPFRREFPISRFSYDFKVGNTLIEINPTATHNSNWGLFGRKGKDKYYHRNKSNLATSNGYRCINIFDWDNEYKIVKLLGNRERVYARKCRVGEIDNKTASDFINENHLQGNVPQDISIGLFDSDDNLISVMTFGKPRYNKNFQFELLRFCSSKNVIGGSEKLFKFFERKFSPTSIISYCDRSKFSGKTYEKLGFSFVRETVGKHWYNIKTKQHITDNLLRQRGFDQLFGTCYGKGVSNEELMLQHGFVVVYDAGQFTYAKEYSNV